MLINHVYKSQQMEHRQSITTNGESRPDVSVETKAYVGYSEAPIVRLNKPFPKMVMHERFTR
jgi:hypothetical protein